MAATRGMRDASPDTDRTVRAARRRTRSLRANFYTGQEDGGWVFAAGVNVDPHYGCGIGKIWYARERALSLASI